MNSLIHALKPSLRPLGLCLTVAVVLAGCRSSRPNASLAVSAGEYATAFDAARETLRSHGFDLERVDSTAGIILSQPKASAGLATPWDLDQSGLGQEAADLVNHHKRRVRITFAGEGVGDQVQTDKPLTATVSVFIDRVQSPGLRIPSKAPMIWSVTSDPARTQQGVGSQYQAPVERDSELELRLAEEIETRIAKRAVPR